MFTEQQLDIKEQINEVKAYLYCNTNMPSWIKELCKDRLQKLKTREKILDGINNKKE